MPCDGDFAGIRKKNIELHAKHLQMLTMAKDEIDRLAGLKKE